MHIGLHVEDFDQTTKTCFQVFLEAVRQLLGPNHTHHLESLAWLVSLMLGVIAIKFVLWLYCRHNQSEIVRIYAEDHRNDVLTNSIGLAGAQTPHLAYSHAPHTAA